jgi:hypothetical protein
LLKTRTCHTWNPILFNEPQLISFHRRSGQNRSIYFVFHVPLKRPTHRQRSLVPFPRRIPQQKQLLLPRRSKFQLRRDLVFRWSQPLRHRKRSRHVGLHPADPKSAGQKRRRRRDQSKNRNQLRFQEFRLTCVITRGLTGDNSAISTGGNRASRELEDTIVSYPSVSSVGS